MNSATVILAGGEGKYLVVFAGEELDSHNGEYEPEDEAHQQHVEDGGDGLHQRVHHHLDTHVQ
jgi:hypothetical protein